MEESARLVRDTVRELFATDVEVQLLRPETKFGDLATNVALTLAKPLGKNPREIAEQIVEKLKKQDIFVDVKVAGAGFINMRLSDAYLIRELNKMLATSGTYGRPNFYEGKIVVTEYSDPNPFKVLHVGHLYTSVVGDAISNLIELAGGKVHRVNFGGDVGMHVAKTMWAIIDALGGEKPEKLAEIPKEKQADWLGEQYVIGTRAYEDDPAAKAAITENNKKIYALFKDNDTESPFAKIYWTCRQWSYDYFNDFYDRIGSKFEKYYPESKTAEIGLATVLEQRDAGIYQDSDGAVIFNGEPYGLHTRVFINSEGLPTYEAKDVGLSILKWQDYHFDQSVIITGNEQADYMTVVIKSIEQFAPDLAERTLHLTHGMVKLAGAEKMSSRKGNFLRAVDVLELVADEYTKTQGQADDASVLGAIKYAFLKNRLGADLVFEPRESINMTGNSGSYLQYSHARARSILRKIDFDKDSAAEAQDLDEHERSLMVKMTEWPEVLGAAVNELAPHLVCTYLYELGQTFSRFYENAKVEGDPRVKIRAQLVAAYAGVLSSGLGVLGITAPEKM
ncbi:MAG: arginine--tRNA ligase [Candidatus Nomurabacteria bacterium]|jgi:arginyl-tRNA synthetase|nr:arginine--tRNA ligase [Candidatus Nomurabacteria bacterium]